MGASKQIQNADGGLDFEGIAESNKILEIKVGSDLFGTRTPDSGCVFGNQHV